MRIDETFCSNYFVVVHSIYVKVINQISDDDVDRLYYNVWIINNNYDITK